ncbi:MAG TPA: hypothetical protein VGE40_12850 [Bacilli bacterium]
MHRLINSDKGAVSIFLMMIISSIFVFNVLLIDLARVRIAENQAENILKTAARSSLSAFNPELLTYGLFGLERTPLQGSRETEKLLQDNLIGHHGPNEFVLVSLGLKDQAFSYNQLYSLGNHAVLEHQILEEMKYKAPIEFTRGIMSKLTEAAPAIKNAEQFMQNAIKLEALIDKRDRNLTNAWKQVTVMKNEVESYYGTYSNILEQNTATMDQGKLVSVTRKAIPEQLFIQQVTGKIQVYLEEAKKTDEEIAKEINSILRERPKELDGTDKDEVFKKVPILGNAYFVKFRIEVSEVGSLFSGFISRLSHLSKDVDSRSELIQLNRLYYDKCLHTFNSINTDELKRQREKTLLESEKTRHLNQTQSTIDKVKKTSRHNVCTYNTAHLYEKLNGEEGLYNKYSQLNKGTVDMKTQNSTDNSSLILGEAGETGQRSLFTLHYLLDLLEKARNEIYINEYALNYFNYKTYSSDLANSKAAVTLSNFKTHALQSQEVEYLLYGLESCLGNTAAAYAELFAIRLAFRTAEALSDSYSLSLGSPIMVLISSLTKAAAAAYQDMERLNKGEDVELMNRLQAVKMNYKDYLKLFLFLHSNHHKLLARMQALIELNTGEDLSGKATFIQTTAAFTLKLWFIPGLIKTLGLVGFLEGSIEQNHYVITKSAVMSY